MGPSKWIHPILNLRHHFGCIRIQVPFGYSEYGKGFFLIIPTGIPWRLDDIEEHKYAIPAFNCTSHQLGIRPLLVIAAPFESIGLASGSSTINSVLEAGKDLVVGRVWWLVRCKATTATAGAQPSRDDPVLRGRIRLCSLTWNPAFEFWWIPFNALVLCWGLLNYWFLALATRLFILRWYTHINSNHLHLPCIMFIHFICNYPHTHTHTHVCVCVYMYKYVRYTCIWINSSNLRHASRWLARRYQMRRASCRCGLWYRSGVVP